MHRTRTFSRFLILLAVAVVAVLWLTPTQAAPAAQDNSTQVYALPGQLRAANNQPFATYLVANDGALYGLSGETPQVEDQIVAYRDENPGAEFKVWGTLYPNGQSTDAAEIVVKSIQPSDPAGSADSPLRRATPPAGGRALRVGQRARRAWPRVPR